MPNDFIFVKLRDTEQDVEVFSKEEEMVEKTYAKLLKKVSLKLYYKKLIKKLPMKLGEFQFLGDSIPCVMLPFTKEQKACLPRRIKTSAKPVSYTYTSAIQMTMFKSPLC